MPIEIPSPEGSEQIVDRVRDAVGERFGESLTVTPAYRVEVVDLLSFTTSLGTAFNSHSPGRWQCLVGGVDDPQAAVDLVEEDGDYAVVSINEGTMAELLSSAAAAGEQLLGDERYEFRLFEVPKLHFAAARLVGIESETEDQYVPLVALGDVTPMRTYLGHELARRLADYVSEDEHPGAPA